MLHPSYSDLMRVVNDSTEDDTPVVNSRFSIVMATSKRARQIIASNTATEAEKAKPLSTAVEELNDGVLRIVSAETEEEDKLPVGEFEMRIAAQEEEKAAAEEAEQEETAE